MNKEGILIGKILIGLAISLLAIVLGIVLGFFALFALARDLEEAEKLTKWMRDE